MVCDICGQTEATVHLTEIINGKVTELHLCEECAREKGTQMEQHFGISDLLAGLADLSPDVEMKQDVVLKCNNCGMSYKDFKKIGKFGCSQCYESFRQHVPALLKRVHGSTKYVGKEPNAGEYKVVRDELQELRSKLQIAIEKEEYEKAAQIRDEIREIERERAKDEEK
ncbi:MAG: UvrB/UvrC motif-containing protein [Candidatus Saelkia tenebricola]|nr:UvrB/UvrC motif-containing protein [Candidatus Saelkia tenebricola]